ncbi:hypothetical protein EK0264_11700 [Epidermidibacterium keratini]|uniref:Uncharacterized protein n=1 Tax=Epidermidibacterium keratini TaxID=1891644 RepID=A0A7L4YPR7_9ACTN|nr:hypothetical protein [Epidermidibacterium keratini]QHC00884.1 hypothetical protein EK0264_11700 [Epidermidibacterium keratini]
MTSAEQVLPAPRTRLEARAYAALHGCACPGDRTTESRLCYLGDDLIEELTTVCAECSQPHTFRFAVTETPKRPPRNDKAMFGYPFGTSELLNVDDWTAIADQSARLGTAEGLRIAVAALEEARRSPDVDSLTQGRLTARQASYAESLETIEAR